MGTVVAGFTHERSCVFVAKTVQFLQVFSPPVKGRYIPRIRAFIIHMAILAVRLIYPWDAWVEDSIINPPLPLQIFRGL